MEIGQNESEKQKDHHIKIGKQPHDKFCLT